MGQGASNAADEEGDWPAWWFARSNVASQEQLALLERVAQMDADAFLRARAPCAELLPELWEFARYQPLSARRAQRSAAISSLCYKLVPRACAEAEFWRLYWCHVHDALAASGLERTPGFSRETLMAQDDRTTNAIVAVFERHPPFVAFANRETNAILERDAEDDEKLKLGIKLAVGKGVLAADPPVEPVTRIDVLGKSATEVADLIVGALGESAETGCVVTLQGLSGTGKGTTVDRVKARLPNAVTWCAPSPRTRGSVRPAALVRGSVPPLTGTAPPYPRCPQEQRQRIPGDHTARDQALRRARPAAQRGRCAGRRHADRPLVIPRPPHSRPASSSCAPTPPLHRALGARARIPAGKYDLSAVLTPDAIAGFMGALHFGWHREAWDIRIEGGLGVLVSEVANTMLKVPVIGKHLPLVAEQTQGEVVAFASSAAAKMGGGGKVVLMEGRAPTLEFVRTPYRFELTMSDPVIIGMRRAAQRMMAQAVSALKAVPDADETLIATALLKALADCGR